MIVEERERRTYKDSVFVGGSNWFHLQWRPMRMKETFQMTMLLRKVMARHDLGWG